MSLARTIISTRSPLTWNSREKRFFMRDCGFDSKEATGGDLAGGLSLPRNLIAFSSELGPNRAGRVNLPEVTSMRFLFLWAALTLAVASALHAAAPLNDNFTNAIAITGLNVLVKGT